MRFPSLRIPARAGAALALGAVLGAALVLAGPWLSVGSTRPLASPAVRWSLVVIVLWGVLAWSLRRSALGPLLALLGLLIAAAGASFGWRGVHPLRPLAVRVVLVTLLVFGYLAWLGWRAWRRHGREHDLRQLLRALRRLLLPTPDERRHTPLAQLQARAAQEQWQALHARAGWRGRLQAWRAGSTLPWYLVLGASGCGKSTLLASSTLRLLRCRGDVFDAAGTHASTWWVGERAVFVEASLPPDAADAQAGDPLAAHPAAAPSEHAPVVAASHEEAWQGLLDVLRRRRAELPLHGVVLSVEAAWLLRAGAEPFAAAVAAMRRRVLQLHAVLGSHVPVYLVMTKADALPGFDEFFEAFDAHARGRERDALWGFTLPWGSGPAAAGARMQDVAHELALLQQGLQGLLPACLHHEPRLARRCRLYEFPHAHAELAARLRGWLDAVFAQWPETPAPAAAASLLRRPMPAGRGLALRGVFLGSNGSGASQAGTGAGARFLGGVLRDGLLADAGLARIDDPRVRRRRLRRALAGAALPLSAVALMLALHGSYGQSREQLDALQGRGQRLQQRVDEASRGAPDPAAWRGVLMASQAFDDQVRQMPRAWWLGESALQPVRDAADALLLRLQQALLVPPLARRLHEQLEQALRDERLADVIDTLDAYMMLHDPQAFDADRMRAWIARHGAAPGVAHALEHPVGVLRETAAPDPVLVRRARAWLSGCERGRRLWQLVRIRERMAPRPAPFTLAVAQDGQAQRVFVSAAGPGADRAVDGWYTARAWRELMQPRLAELARDAAVADKRLLADGASLPASDVLSDELRQAYWLDYARAWTGFLEDVRPLPMSALDAQLQLLRALGSEQSPLLALVRRVWPELEVLRASEAAQSDPVAQRLLELQPLGDGDANGAAPRALRDALDAYYTAVSMAAGDVAAGRADAEALTQADARLRARAGALPPPVGAVLAALADDTSARMRGAGSGAARRQAEQVRERIAGAFAEQVAGPCARTLAGRFPLSRNGPDANLEDFVGFFGPDGSAQRYFDSYLKPWVDTSRRPWRYRASPPDASASPAGDALPQQAAQELLRMLRQKGPDPEAFARIERVRRALWRPGAATPSWNFDISVPSLDPSFAMLRLQVDSQTMRYAHGPVVAWNARWPGPQPMLGARLRLEPLDGGAPIEYAAQGPWAWMRVLAHGRRRPSGAAGGVDLEFGPRHHSVVLHLGGAEPNPWNPGLLEGFTCPR